ncbi:MAG TPA: enoyl-CoA hydratase/isomerase family protein [Acidobacteriota bacterium]|nr:enoyl-CoA hydratase/isomerase family protein [Acidobacteriota bacterium]
MNASAHLLLEAGQDRTRLELASRHNTLTRLAIAELLAALESHARDDGSRVLIISGQGSRFFSPGFDLRQVSALQRAEMEDMIEAFEGLMVSLLRHPKPVLAQLNGDALAGGCILASCCDFRLARRGALIGMTPLNFSVAVPYTAQQVFRHLLGFSRARRPLWLGENYPVEKALGMGWIDQVESEEKLPSAVDGLARRLAAGDPAAFRTSKDFLLAPLLRQIDPPSPHRRRDFLDCWFSASTQSRLRATLRNLDSKTS